MSNVVVIPGATPVSLGTGAANALQLLGYTVNGAEITTEQIIEDVPGDQGGGEGGIPIDFQYFGQIARGTLEFSSWDPAVLAKIESAVNANGTLSTITAGNSPVPGSLILANAAYFRLLINPPNVASLIRNYPITLIREPKTFTNGTKWSRLILPFVAYPNLTTSPPLLWNNVTT